jgi:WD40 repeat protein
MRLLDLTSGRELRVFGGHHGGVRAVAVSPDGRFALAGSEGVRESSLKLWNLDSGAEVRTVDAKAGVANPYRGFRSIAFLPDGNRAVTCGYDHSIRKWDLSAEEDPPVFGDADRAFTSVAVSSDGKSVVVGSDDGSVKMYDLNSGREMRSFYGCTQGVRSVAISRNNALILAAGLDNRLRVWTGTGASETRPRLVHERYADIWFTGDGLVCVAELRDGGVVSLDTATGLPLRRLNVNDPAVRDFRRDEKPPRLTRRNAVDGVVLSRWGERGTELLKIPWDSKRDCSVRASIDGSLVLGAQDDGNVRIWDVRSRALVDTFATGTGVTRAAFSRDGTRLITAGFVDYVMHVWDIRTHKQLRSFQFSSVVEFDFSPNGLRVLTGDNTGLAQLWDVETGQEVRRFVGHGSAVTGVGFRDGGRVVVTVSSDNTARMRDVETGLLIGSFGGAGKLVGWDVSDDARAIMTLRWTGSLPLELRTYTLDHAAADRRFEEQLPPARRYLSVDPDDPAALQILGEWYAFRGLSDTAIAVLERARKRGTGGPALPLARCYWQSNRSAEAAREFQRAIDQKEAPDAYLRLCLEATKLHPGTPLRE